MMDYNKIRLYGSEIKMGLPQLERCCFIFDLKTGNIVMGCLNAALSFVLFVTMIVVAVTFGDLKETLVFNDPEEQAAMTGAYAMSIILLLMFLAKLLFDVFFIYGVIVERAGVIKAYFVMWLVFFLLSMFTFFVNVSRYNAWTICVEVFYIGFNVYAILLSHSFYKQLNNREIV